MPEVIFLFTVAKFGIESVFAQNCFDAEQEVLRHLVNILTGELLVGKFGELEEIRASDPSGDLSILSHQQSTYGKQAYSLVTFRFGYLFRVGGDNNSR